jgi:hypothetical protein
VLNPEGIICKKRLKQHIIPSGMWDKLDVRHKADNSIDFYKTMILNSLKLYVLCDYVFNNKLLRLNFFQKKGDAKKR